MCLQDQAKKQKKDTDAKGENNASLAAAAAAGNDSSHLADIFIQSKHPNEMCDWAEFINHSIN